MKHFFFSLLVAFLVPLASADPIKPRASISSAIKRITSVLKKSGVSKLPSASKALSSSSSSAIVNPREVSGTPPLLSGIPTLVIRNLFWRQGVVNAIANGTPTQSQCAEFFSSPIDGNSGGLGACHLVEAVGRAFQTILDAETSLCYIKNFPTQENLNASGILINSGKLPGNNITKLFLAGEKTRLVKINAPAFRGRGQAEAIFVKIPSVKANENAQRLYRADLYICPPGQGPRASNVIQVNNNGLIKVTIGNRSDPFGGGANKFELRGSLKASDGSLLINPLKSRTLEVRRQQDDDISKVSFEISSINKIKLKRRDTVKDVIYKDYSLALFSGTNALDAQFLEGAFQGETTRDGEVRSFSGGTEYRTPVYASAPNDSLVEQAESYDIGSDSFYQADATIDVNTASYDCGATPSVELTMVEGNATLEASLDSCFNDRLENMNFCRKGQAIEQAEKNFIPICVRGNPPP